MVVDSIVLSCPLALGYFHTFVELRVMSSWDLMMWFLVWIGLDLTKNK